MTFLPVVVDYNKQFGLYTSSVMNQITRERVREKSAVLLF